ncbi:MAG TPA: GPGG-motif small membrane protein [Actinomycetota bacterium]|nr:GPGG-motif small membrane protein [Actinomycetota bacterium]
MELALVARSCGGAGSVLWIIAAILVIAGIVTILRGGILAGILLIIVGLAVGPGGFSVFC